jgi:hypothetical protein
MISEYHDPTLVAAIDRARRSVYRAAVWVDVPGMPRSLLVDASGRVYESADGKIIRRGKLYPVAWRVEWEDSDK